MKRFVICMDGTWQTLRQSVPTNIGVIARSIAHNAKAADGSVMPQIVIYTQGVGSTIGALKDRKGGFSGGVFGTGLEDSIVDTYLRLCFNYEAGDEIFIFGFSRGAFSARSLAGLINFAGILSRRHCERAVEAFRLYRRTPLKNPTPEQEAERQREAVEFRRLYGKGYRDTSGARHESTDVPKIQYMGIFDTVGQRGVPSAFGPIANWMNQKYQFHNLKLCPNVLAARHALAIDERRIAFPPTLWDAADDGRHLQRWFTGAHGDVGGGTGSELSAYPLQWIVEGAEQAGLAFYPTEESPLRDVLGKARFDATISRARFPDTLDPINWAIGWRRVWRDKDHPTPDNAKHLLHDSVIKRAESAAVRPPYAPPPLRPFRKGMRTVAEHLLPEDELRPQKHGMFR